MSTEYLKGVPITSGFHRTEFEKQLYNYYSLHLFDGLLHQNIIHLTVFFFLNDSVARFHSAWDTAP
jgi:hypothetical protein